MSLKTQPNKQEKGKNEKSRKWKKWGRKKEIKLNNYTKTERQQKETERKTMPEGKKKRNGRKKECVLSILTSKWVLCTLFAF